MILTNEQKILIETTYKSKPMTLTECARLCNVSYFSVWKILNKDSYVIKNQSKSKSCKRTYRCICNRAREIQKIISKNRHVIRKRRKKLDAARPYLSLFKSGKNLLQIAEIMHCSIGQVTKKIRLFHISSDIDKVKQQEILKKIINICNEKITIEELVKLSGEKYRNIYKTIKKYDLKYKSGRIANMEKRINQFKNSVGSVFYKLTIIEFKEDEDKFICQCECGNKTVIRTTNWKKIMSCGCLREQSVSQSETLFLNKLEQMYSVTIERQRKYKSKLFDGQWKNILFEIDGHIWHNKQCYQDNDKLKNEIAKEQKLKLYRFRVDTINDVDKVILENIEKLDKIFKIRTVHSRFW